MKRSEMVDFIYEMLYGLYDQESEGIVKRKHADKLLSLLEDKGVAPPLFNFKGNHSGCLCTMRESCSSCGGPSHEWEEE